MKRSIARLLVFAIVGTLPLSLVHGQAPADQNPTETLIRNATVLTITRGVLANTDVLIRRG